ncbi:MAG: hypothetical protein BGO10_05510 [Chlamydia sp. 32-24]|nr:MAG: hypothetical protein BGO10_05510 [Chlamydia sp. 32-24]
MSEKLSIKNSILLYGAMSLVVIASNLLVTIPINNWLTWGTFPYPFSFLITEISNALYGPIYAKNVVYLGFCLGILLSFYLAPLKIAIASGTAFLIAQLLDIFIFYKLRNKGNWWFAPFIASCFASFIDTLIFYSIAFYGENLPSLSWAMGDFTVKLVFDFALLYPFRKITRNKVSKYNKSPV